MIGEGSDWAIDVAEATAHGAADIVAERDRDAVEPGCGELGCRRWVHGDAMPPQERLGRHRRGRSFLCPLWTEGPGRALRPAGYEWCDGGGEIGFDRLEGALALAGVEV